MLHTPSLSAAQAAPRNSVANVARPQRRPAVRPQALAAVDGEIVLATGETVRYRMLGERAAPLHVLLGGISADRCVDDWWQDLLGVQGSIDLRRNAVLSLDWLQRPRPGQDCIRTSDQSAALAAVLDALGRSRIDVLIGASYGAMVGLAFAACHPQRIGHLVAISGAHRASASATACRWLQREIIHLAQQAGDNERGMMLARALALTSYRPAALFDQRFAAATPDLQQAGLRDYFVHQGNKLAQRFDLQRYLSLSASLDQHLVDVSTIRCRVDLVAVRSDHLVPLAQMQALAAELGARARLHVLASDYGHDAFLKSTRQLNVLLTRLLTANGIGDGGDA